MSRKKTQNNANIILERVCNRYHLKNDDDMAAFFHVKPSTVSSWRTRNAPPYDLIHAKCMIHIGYILTGEEPRAAPDPGAEYWKNKYIACMEELNEARKRIDRLTASPTVAVGRNTAAGQ